ncbi:reverse transcriptase domain-containing protein [Tanacetum coccineum]
MVPAATPLVGFSGEIIWPLGKISLLVKIGDEEHSTSAWMNFMVVRSPSPYNGIIGRPGVRRIQAVLSTAHGMLKFPVIGETVTLRSSRIVPLECTMVSGPGAQPPELCGLLRRNLDIFAWKPADMTGVPRHIAEHRLNFREGCLPVRQKKRGQAPERNKAIYEEVEKLVNADIMKEVHYHSWLSNPVMVKKHDGSWRMCVDFKDLNKACPKDGYPLPEIDWKVCPDKVEAVLNLPSPKCLKDVQKLNGKLASLNRFLSKSAEKSLPFFKTLKNCIKKSDFQWTTEAEMAFKQMKKLIAELPMPRTSVKRQILADFIVERPEDDSLDTPIEDKEELSDPWILLTDGSSCIDGSEAGLILTNPEGVEFTYALRFMFEATNNEAEYKALIADLRIAEQIVPRGENKKSDALSKIASTSFVHLSKQVLVEELKEKSIDEKEVLVVVEEEGCTWMIPIYEYLMKEILLEEKKKARAIHHKAGRDNPFKDWCEKLCIRQCFASVKHPQANGLVERANRSLGERMKARLDERSKNWLEEISHVLWAHRTMIKSSNRETPFSLTYGTKVVIPVEIGMPTLRTAEVDIIKNNEALEINLDLLEDRREQEAIQEAKSKAKMEKDYNARVCNTSFKPGDLFYRNNEASHAEDGGKLGPKWEGPYEVTEALGKGTYKLRDRSGNILPRTWNVCNLKKCYVHEM